MIGNDFPGLTQKRKQLSDMKGIEGTLIALMLMSASAGAWGQEIYEELPDPCPADEKAWTPVRGVLAGWGSTGKRYAKGEPAMAGKPKSTLSLKAWRGEKVSAQLVVWGSEGIDSLNVTTGDFCSSEGVIPSSSVNADFVRYVMTDELNKDGKGGCGYRVNSEFDSSLVADCIDHKVKYLGLAPRSTRPVWVSVEVPRDAAPGRYAGSIAVKDGDMKIAELKLNIDVESRVLPETPAFHLDLWQNPYAVARYHGVPLFSKEHFEFMRPVMERYADAGGKVITVPVIYKPWNGQTYDPFMSMVTWIRKADGSWMYDYTAFDMWVEYMMSLGIDGQINCYSMIPWGLSFRYLDQASDSFVSVSLEPGTPEYEEFWGGMLRSFAAHLKEKGWFDRTMMAMDERPMEQMLAAVEVIKNADPDFKVAYAGVYHDELLDVLDYYCIPVTEKYPEGTAAQRRSEGRITTYYTCCSEPWPNTFSFSDPDEAEWLGWYIAANDLDGYLRWALNSWPEDPLRDSRFTAWAAGDTYLIYPEGRTSIRFERLCEGITAYEKVRALKEEFVRESNAKGLKDIEKALALFRLPEGGEFPDAGQALEEAGRILGKY